MSSFNVGSFITLVREKQFDIGKPAAGPLCLSPETRHKISQAANEILTPPEANVFSSDIALMGERFEEMCRRQKRDIFDHSRPKILSHLATELVANASVLDIAPKKLVPITTYNGAILCGLHREFDDFIDTPWLFKRASTIHPFKPRAFLAQIQNDVARMMDEKEFQDLASARWIFIRAASSYPKDPRGFLRQVQSNIATLSKEEAFKGSPLTPGILKRAAVLCPNRAEQQAKETLTAINALQAKEEFHEFKERPWVIKHVATYCSSNPEERLRRIQGDIENLRENPTLGKTGVGEGLLTRAATYYPQTPHKIIKQG